MLGKWVSMRHVVLTKQLDQPGTSTWSRSSTIWYVKQINLLSFEFANMVVAQWEGVVGNSTTRLPISPTPYFMYHQKYYKSRDTR
jgi:hypothetical protein